MTWQRALKDETMFSAEPNAKLSPHLSEEPGGDSCYGYAWVISNTDRGKEVIKHHGEKGIF